MANQIFNIGPKKSRYLEQMLAQAMSAKPVSPLGALGNLANIWAKKRELGQAEEAAAKKQTASNEMLAGLLGSGSAGGAMPGASPGGGGRPPAHGPPMNPGGAEGMLAFVRANPDLLSDPRLMQTLQFAQTMEPQAAERNIMKDVAGRQRYQDTGEYVFPDAKKEPDKTATQKDYEYAKAQGFTGSFTAYKQLSRAQTTLNTTVEGDEAPIPEDIQKLKLADEYEQSGNMEYANALRNDVWGKRGEKEKTAVSSILPAREALSELYTRVKEKGIPLPFSEESLSQDQLYSTLKSEYINLAGRGANFTKNEEEILEDVLGGGPGDFMKRIIAGDEAYLKRLEYVGNLMDSKARALGVVREGGEVGDFAYPWQVAGTTTAVPETDRPVESTPLADDEMGGSDAEFKARALAKLNTLDPMSAMFKLYEEEWR